MRCRGKEAGPGEYASPTLVEALMSPQDVRGVTFIVIYSLDLQILSGFLLLEVGANFLLAESTSLAEILILG